MRQLQDQFVSEFGDFLQIPQVEAEGDGFDDVQFGGVDLVVVDHSFLEVLQNGGSIFDCGLFKREKGHDFIFEQSFESFFVVEVDIVLILAVDHVGDVSDDECEVVLALMVVLESVIDGPLEVAVEAEEQYG